jgi:hypothetical protein
MIGAPDPTEPLSRRRATLARGRRPVAIAAAALAIAIALAGCAGARNMLGTSASSCFEALPGANDAVHRQGHLVGVRRLPASVLQQRLPRSASLDALSPKSSLCVFAFRGPFVSNQIVSALPGVSGNYAVVAFNGTKPGVVAAFVVDHLPTRFRHLRA